MSNTDYISSVQASLQSGYYGLVNLSLASISYLSSKDPSGMASAFTAAFSKIQPLPNAKDGPDLSGGAWALEWGPAVDKSNSNLCYVANYSIGGSKIFRVVGVRGTAISDGTIDGLIKQLKEDLRAFGQTDWMKTLLEYSLIPKYNPFKRKVASGFDLSVANGSTSALTAVLNAGVVTGGVGTGNLISYLYSQEADISTVPLVVTGHSLGGALTQVVSAYLAWQIGGAFASAKDIIHEPVLTNIFPAAFAPPTVGGPTFATRYDHIFPNNYFYYNNGDVVPCAYANVRNIEGLWANYDENNKACTHAPCPPLLKGFIDLFINDLPLYARPTNHTIGMSAPYMCNNTCMTDFLKTVNMTGVASDPWVAQLVWQHFPPCYYQCMTQNIQNLAPYDSFVPVPLSCSTSS